MSARDIPNLLGYFRIVTTPLLLFFILSRTAWGYAAAAVLLFVMAISDMLDGKLARKYGVVSPLGVFLDTTSDKIFVAAALIPLSEIGMLSSWITWVIISRDALISGLRSYAAAEGVVIAAGQWGKQKLTITVTGLIWLLLHLALTDLVAQGVAVPWFMTALTGLWPIPMGLAVIWTVGSGAEYIWKALPLLRNDRPEPPVAPTSTTKPPVQ